LNRPGSFFNPAKEIGVEIPVGTIVDEAEAFSADIIGLSGLLTLAFEISTRR
jgi:cobalamin-dependent methionine synthase I